MTAIRTATPDDLPAILDIFNDAILHTTAVYHEQPHTLEMRRAWFADKQAGGWPVLVADVDGRVAGFGAFGPFRPHEAYRLTAEHSLYVAPDFRRRGIGAQLLEALIAAARARGLHALIGGIDADNAVSLALHQRHGFIEVAHMPQVARKFNRWLDLKFVHLLLPGQHTNA